MQHHRAHIGAVMAEYGITGSARGIALDGVGLGTDGKAWGGEMLHLTPAGFTREAHLLAIPLPGGDRAAREPWRMASSVLEALGRGDEIAERFREKPNSGMIRKVIANPRLSGVTTAMGRWFDAASALLGLCLTQHDEATAAMRLESAAEGKTPREFGKLWEILPDGSLSLLPLMAMLADTPHEPDAVSQASADFHEGVARALSDWILQLTGPDEADLPLCLAGGCFLNRRMTVRLISLLGRAGIHPLLSSAVPPGDGGVALGQAWLAALARREGALDGGDRVSP